MGLMHMVACNTRALCNFVCVAGDVCEMTQCSVFRKLGVRMHTRKHSRKAGSHFFSDFKFENVINFSLNFSSVYSVH